jgi:hypothetical protein
MSKRTRNLMLIFLFLGLFGLNLAQYSAVQAKKPQPKDIMTAYNEFHHGLNALVGGLDGYEQQVEQKDRLQALSTAVGAAVSMRHDFQTVSERAGDRYQLSLSMLEPNLVDLNMAVNQLMASELKGQRDDELFRKTKGQVDALEEVLQNVAFDDKQTAKQAYDQVQAFAVSHPPLF